MEYHYTHTHKSAYVFRSMGIVTSMETFTLPFTIRELRGSQDVHRIIHSYLPSSIVEYSYYDFVSLIIYDSNEQWNNYLLSHPIAYEILYVEWDRPNGCFRTHYEEEVLENGEIHIVEEVYEIYL